METYGQAQQWSQDKPPAAFLNSPQTVTGNGSSVRREMDVYAKLLSELHAVISGISDKLNDVAPDHAPKDVAGSPTPQAPVSSPLANGIQTLNGQLAQAIHRLNSLGARIDL